MSTPDFRAVWWKLDRASQHRYELDREIGDYFAVEANRPRCVGKYEPDRGYYVFRVTYVPPDIDDFLTFAAIAVGDAVHNLRSALDYLAYQLAIAEAARVGRALSAAERGRIYFPIHTRWLDGAKAGWKRKENSYRRLFGDVNAAAIKRFQPYRGRARGVRWGVRLRHPLTVLNRVSNRDKHRLPNVVAALPSGFSVEPIEGASIEWFATVRSRVKLGAEVARMRLAGVADPQVEMDAEISPRVAFSEGSTVTAVIDTMTAYVYGIVKTFDPDGRLPRRLHRAPLPDSPSE